MTTIYFIRHAEPNYQNHDDPTRELTEKGLQDRKLVTQFLADKHVDTVLSSPYKRAVDTVAHFAQTFNYPIKLVPGFRERRVEKVWIDDFDGFCKRQWEDFDFRLTDGETLREVQTRNIAALNAVLDEYPDQTVVIGSHGTALSTIMNYYNQSFGYDEFIRIKDLMPWIVSLTFEGHTCLSMEEYNLFA